MDGIGERRGEREERGGWRCVLKSCHPRWGLLTTGRKAWNLSGVFRLIADEHHDGASIDAIGSLSQDCSIRPIVDVVRRIE